MKAISVKQPWASLIVHGIKDIENRTWVCPQKHIGHRVLVHASLKGANFWDSPVAGRVDEFLREISKSGTDWSNYPNGAIIGSVKIVDCVQNHSSVWAEKGVFNWVLSDPILFDKPIAAKGKLSFWNFDIPKDGRHHHYWIEDGILYETYSTIRGNRYRELYKVNCPDIKTVNDEELSKIEILNA